jgi:hypothetical protein
MIVLVPILSSLHRPIMVYARGHVGHDFLTQALMAVYRTFFSGHPSSDAG